MRLRYWFFNPVGVLRNQYQKTVERVEDQLEVEVLSLPQPAPWTKRLTQVILVGLTSLGIWSVVTRVDVVVTAIGKLEPISQSQGIQARSSGVIAAVLVHEGEQVKQGQVLVQLDKTALNHQLQALSLQKEQLVEEIAVLKTARQGESLAILDQTGVNLSPELLNRVQTRQLLTAQLTGNPAGLTPEQQQRFQLFQQQLVNRLSVDQLQASGLDAQITQNDEELEKTEFQLEVEQELLTNLQPLLDEGAISRVDISRRRVDVNTLQRQLNQIRLQKNQLQLNQLQRQVESKQFVTATRQDLQNQLAALDAEFDNTITANERELIQLNSQLNQIKLDLKNQDLRAPVNGVVFNLRTRLAGGVTQPGQALLQVVPDESLIARVQVANADIANIQVGMPVDVRLDAYPFTEFGAVKGVVSKVGNEAVMLDQNSMQTVFPVEIRLEQQFIERGSERFNLIPGMSLGGNIIVRSRAPISYVADELIKVFDSMQSVK